MKGKAAGALISLALMASCGSQSQTSENGADNVAIDYGTAVDASAPPDDSDNVAMENKADAIEGPDGFDRSKPDTDITVRNKHK